MNPISEIEITPVKPNSGLVAFASFVLYDAIYCSSVGIVTRPNGGYRLVYPTKKVQHKNIDIFHPISRQVGMLIEQEVVKKLNDVMSYDNGRHSGFGVTV